MQRVPCMLLLHLSTATFLTILQHMMGDDDGPLAADVGSSPYGLDSFSLIWIALALQTSRASGST